MNLKRREYQLRSESEIGRRLRLLKQNKLEEEPYSELKTIARNATKQALKWVLEESDKLLT